MRLLFLCVSVTCVAILPLFGAENNMHPVTTDLPPSVNAASTSNELVLLDRLIDATQHSLDNQKNLRIMIKNYQDMQNAYLKNTDNNELLLRLAKEAYVVLENIKENHLDHSFDPEFISELALFAKVAAKRGIPSPVVK